MRALSSQADALSAKAVFIFTATVVQRKGTTMAAFPASDRTAIVQITRVLRPEGADSHVGQRITVQSSKTWVEGKEAVFFANPIFYGESLAVDEVGRIEVTRDEDRMRQLENSIRFLPTDAQTERLSRAVL